MHHSYRFRGVGDERHEDQDYGGYQEWTVCINVLDNLWQDLLGDNFGGLDKLMEVSEVQFFERVGEGASEIMRYLKC